MNHSFVIMPLVFLHSVFAIGKLTIHQVGGDRSRARVLGVDDTVSSDDSDEDHVR